MDERLYTRLVPGLSLIFLVDREQACEIYRRLDNSA